MKWATWGQVCVSTAALACTFAVAAPRVEAADWIYRWDSFSDGTGDRTEHGGNGNHGIGYQSNFEFFGMAVLEDLEKDSITFAFNTNVALEGWPVRGTNVGLGDLFINLDPTKTFTQAEGTESLLAIRFATANDSELSGTGLFSNVVGKDVTKANHGWQSYSNYENYVGSKQGLVEYIDGKTNAEAKSYLGAHADTVAASGTKLGDVQVITDSAALDALGLNFNQAATNDNLNGPLGTQTYAVSFARSLLPAGELSWAAHIMAECANDIMGMTGTFADIPGPVVPEPTALAALALVGTSLVVARKRR